MLDELRKMGADMPVMGTAAHVRGVGRLAGGSLCLATDVRAAAALVLAVWAPRATRSWTGWIIWTAGMTAWPKSWWPVAPVISRGKVS